MKNIINEKEEPLKELIKEAINVEPIKATINVEPIKEDIKEDIKATINVEPIKEETKTFLNSIKENWLSWIFIVISVVIISYPNVIIGYFTFALMLFLSYYLHLCSHKVHNIFTAIHKYHHSHNNYLSYISQMLLELSFPTILMPLYFIFDTVYLNGWIILLFTLFYSSVHNINYGIFHVNDVHNLHHRFVYTNLGPDICDVIFNTKNTKNTGVENTDHYIPNIIIGTILVLGIKYLYNKNEFNKSWLTFLMYLFLFLCLMFNSLFSLYLYFIYYKKTISQTLYEIYIGIIQSNCN